MNFSGPPRTTTFVWYGVTIEVKEAGGLLRRIRLRRFHGEADGPSPQGGSTEVRKWIDAQFNEGRTIPREYLATGSLTSFQEKVLHGLRDIPPGRTVSYGELAGCVGFPGAARAAGTALRKNPFPLVLPCHRVVRADGSVGGYAGEEESSLKKYLLAREGGDW